MDDKNRQFDEFRVDDSFARDLKKLYGPQSDLPARVDMAVVDMARRKLPRRKAAWWTWTGAAAAAAILLLVMLNLDHRRPAEPIPSDVSFARLAAPQTSEDIDASGRIDMLDALKLAKMLEAGRAGARFDFNRDGVVDKRDIDTVAMAAVRLEKGA